MQTLTRNSTGPLWEQIACSRHVLFRILHPTPIFLCHGCIVRSRRARRCAPQHAPRRHGNPGVAGDVERGAVSSSEGDSQDATCSWGRHAKGSQKVRWRVGGLPATDDISRGGRHSIQVPS